MKLKGVALHKPKVDTGNVRIILTLPKSLKARIDAIEIQGYPISMSGFIRSAIEQALERLESDIKHR
jgi:hypothetical protein